MYQKDNTDINVNLDLNHFEYNKWSKNIKAKYNSNTTYDDILSILDKMNSLV